MKTARILLLSGEAAVLATLVFMLARSDRTAPRVLWRVGAVSKSTEPYQDVDAETPIRLELELPTAAHVYVVSHDLIHGCSALFPSEYLHSDIGANPLPAGKHLLPGQGSGIELSWQSGDGISPFCCMVIVSAEEVPGLREALARFRQMGNAAFPKKSLLGGYSPKAGSSQIPPAGELLHDAIRAAYRLEEPFNDGPMIPWRGHPGVFLKALHLQNRGREPMPGADLRKQVGTSLSKQLEGLAKPAK